MMQSEGRAFWNTCAAVHLALCGACTAQSPAPSALASSGGGAGSQSGAPGTSGGAAGGAGSTSPSSGAGGASGASSGAGTGSVAASGAFKDAGDETSLQLIDGSGADVIADALPQIDASSDGAPTPFCVPGTAGNGSFMLTGGDPPEWQLKPGLVPGKLAPAAGSASFLSATYGLHFPYVVYTSANYAPGRPAIFLVFGDGISTYLNGGFHAATVLDNLTGAGEIPPTVALFIDPPSDGGNPTTVRVQTYDPPTDKYPTFLMTEIIPQVITGKYTISKDPDAWAVVGYSASGGQGWNVVWKRPDNFHKFIGSNASYGAANVAMYGSVDWASIIANSPKHDVRASNVTCAHDLMDQRGSWLTIITNVAMALAAKGNDWRLMTGPNSHYPPVDGERDFPNSLRWMFQGCHFAPGATAN